MSYEFDDANIAVIGGGNIGTQFACICASKGYKVNVFSSKPDLFDDTLEVVDEFGKVTVGLLNKVTDDMGEAVEGCRIIFVTHPAFRLKEVSDQLLPYISENTNIVVVPGTGGAEFAFQECLKAGASLFGLQRVPSVARLEKYGKRVRCEGLRPELFIASVPKEKAQLLTGFMSDLWDIPCKALSNYLNITLTPSNPILHTTRLRTLFDDYTDGKVYDKNPLFYGEWSDKSSCLLLACDEELQDMLKQLDELDLQGIKSLRIHYESNTIKEMTSKISSIKSLHNLLSPMKQVDGGWIPDFNSRYFTADFPYGLAIIEQLADIIGVSTPNIKDTMNWYRSVTKDHAQLNLRENGINNLEDIYTLYQK